jgi:hypothetical protein
LELLAEVDLCQICWKSWLLTYLWSYWTWTSCCLQQCNFRLYFSHIKFENNSNSNSNWNFFQCWVWGRLLKI